MIILVGHYGTFSLLYVITGMHLSLHFVFAAHLFVLEEEKNGFELILCFMLWELISSFNTEFWVEQGPFKVLCACEHIFEHKCARKLDSMIRIVTCR